MGIDNDLKIELIADVNESALLVDGFDDAIIGYASRISLPCLALYDVDKIIEILIERDGMTFEDACEHFDYNIHGSYVGENTPMFAYLFNRE